MQDTRARISEKEKRLEEEMVEEEINHLIQEKNFLHKKVGVLTSHLAAWEGFQQMTGDEEPQGRHEAQQLSQAKMLKVGNVSKMEEKWTHCEESYQGALVPLPEKWSLCNFFISSTDTDAAQPQEDFPELLRRMVNVENPIRKYIELENLGSGAFGEVSRALDIATGGEVAIKKINVQGRIRKEAIAYELMVMKMNRNPNIVTYLESYFLGKHLWLVMEYMDGGTLRDIINETQMSEGEIAVVSREVKDPTCASKDLSKIVWETEAQNGSDFMGQAWFLCCWYAMGKQEPFK
ncbi:serine/threonine-protein kinase ste20-like [Cyanistes caeruleus]|uniref:serine/threonine-protein kinase ste20-like n=1 Tax=Cyanistes caeruleus TaxID=156563 RepID=UPI000CDA2000|nr:serine/threonine-protein kinase ste20-like [Cyanistes caeruleus]